MPLQGQAAQAVQAWTQLAPPLDPIVRAELEAGLVANDIHVALCTAPNDPSRANWEQNIRDLCTDAGVTARSKQNAVLEWSRQRLSAGR